MTSITFFTKRVIKPKLTASHLQSGINDCLNAREILLNPLCLGVPGKRKENDRKR